MTNTDFLFVMVLIKAILFEIISPLLKKTNAVKKKSTVVFTNENKDLKKITSVGLWGGIPFREIVHSKNQGIIHPEDMNILINYPYIDCCHQCIGEEEDYLIVKSDCYIFRVVKSYFYPYSELKFKPLSEVKFINSKGFLEFGQIKGTNWHNNRCEPIYTIEVNKKLKSRRYFNEDLELITQI